MAPSTHLLASWIIAAKTTDNPRDCRLVALAGVLPDLDGLGILADWYNSAVGNRDHEFYQTYHHYWTHGGLAAVVITAVLVCFARRRLRVAFLALLVYHLHLLCDYVGSRGPDPWDKWPIFYLSPFSLHPMWICQWQWPLFGWQNGVISIVLFIWAIAMACERGDSFIGVINRRADAVFAGMLLKWRRSFRARFEKQR